MGKTVRADKMKKTSNQVRHPKDSPVNDDLANSLLPAGNRESVDKGTGDISDVGEHDIEGVLEPDLHSSNQEKPVLAKVRAQDHISRQSSVDFPPSHSKKSGKEVRDAVEITASKKQDKKTVSQDARSTQPMTRRSAQERAPRNINGQQKNTRQSARIAQGLASFINQTSSQACSASTYDIYNSILIEIEDLKQRTSAMETFISQTAHSVASHIQNIREKNTPFRKLYRTLHLKDTYKNNNSESNVTDIPYSYKLLIHTVETAIPSSNIPSIGDMESSTLSDSLNISEDEWNGFHLESDEPITIAKGSSTKTQHLATTSKAQKRTVKRAKTVITKKLVTYIKDASPPRLKPNFFLQQRSQTVPTYSGETCGTLPNNTMQSNDATCPTFTYLPEIKKEIVDDPMEPKDDFAETVLPIVCANEPNNKSTCEHTNDATSPPTPPDSSSNNSSTDSSPPVSIPDVTEKVKVIDTWKRKITRAQTVATVAGENLDEEQKMDVDDIGFTPPQDEQNKTMPPEPPISKGQPVVRQVFKNAFEENTDNFPKRIDAFIPWFYPRPSPMYKLFDTMPMKNYSSELLNVPRKHVKITFTSEYEVFLRLKKLYGTVNYPSPEKVTEEMFISIYYHVDSSHGDWMLSNSAVLSTTGTTKFSLSFDKEQCLYKGDRLTVVAFVHYSPSKKFVSRRAVYRFRCLGDPLAGAAMAGAAVAGAASTSVNTEPEIITIS